MAKPVTATSQTVVAAEETVLELSGLCYIDEYPYVNELDLEHCNTWSLRDLVPINCTPEIAAQIA